MTMPVPKPFSTPLVGRVLALVLLGALIVGGTLALVLATRPSDARLPIAEGSVVAFYGDSYTYGEQASAPEARWSSLVSARQGWVEANASVNGLGFVANRVGTDAVQDVVDADPALIIVTMGLNDTFIAEAQRDELTTAIHDDLARFRAEAPQARLVVVEPFWIPSTSQAPETGSRATRSGAPRTNTSIRTMRGMPSSRGAWSSSSRRSASSEAERRRPAR
jgi:lysophospholipase L1-like esterase